MARGFTSQFVITTGLSSPNTFGSNDKAEQLLKIAINIITLTNSGRYICSYCFVFI